MLVFFRWCSMQESPYTVHSQEEKSEQMRPNFGLSLVPAMLALGAGICLAGPITYQITDVSPIPAGPIGRRDRGRDDRNGWHDRGACLGRYPRMEHTVD